MIKDSKLILQESGKVIQNHSKFIDESIFISLETFQSELPGFYDPCVGEEKSLQIEYTYNGRSQIIKIKENEPLRLPQNAS